MAVFGEQVATQLFTTLAQYGALTPVSYLRLPEPVLDPTTGAVTQTGVSVTHSMRLRDFRREEIDGVQVIIGDRQALLPVVSFLGTPTIRDTLTIMGMPFEVKAVSKSANEGLWVWHLRRVGDA